MFQKQKANHKIYGKSKKVSTFKRNVCTIQNVELTKSHLPDKKNCAITKRQNSTHVKIYNMLTFASFVLFSQFFLPILNKLIVVYYKIFNCIIFSSFDISHLQQLFLYANCCFVCMYIRKILIFQQVREYVLSKIPHVSRIRTKQKIGFALLGLVFVRRSQVYIFDPVITQ